jgi:ATP-dependent DNA helicase RecG
MTTVASPPIKPPQTHAQRALAKLGLVRDIDFALHLPLRYEDETHITSLRDARHGETVQIEAVVTSCEIQTRGKRQLVVTVIDGAVECTLRFFNFYPSHQRAMAVGERLRIRGEIKKSLLGWSMLHPSFKPAGGQLSQVLTAVYPTTAGLPQGYIRKAVWSGLLRASQRGELSETVVMTHLPSLADSLELLHHPTPDVSVAELEDKSHPAWQRLKAEELLAQQLSQLQARRERAKMRAHALQVPPARGDVSKADRGEACPCQISRLAHQPPSPRASHPPPVRGARIPSPHSC